MKINRTATVAVASALALTTSGLAVAQTSVPVSTAMGVGTRVLEVTDLAGEDLDGLALVPGRASAFRVAVRDTAATVIDPNFALEGYDVESSLTNLYATDDGTTYDFLDRIPSGEVTLGSATSPLDVQDALATLEPSYLLSSTGDITCSTLGGALGGLSLTALLSPTCALLASLTGGLSITDVALTGTPLEDIDLSELLASQLPLVPTAGQDAGETYLQADCVNGVGALDEDGCTSGTSGTELNMLSATPADSLVTQLEDALELALPTQITSLDGTGAVAPVADVIAALSASADSAVSTFATRLATEFSQTEQVEVINNLMEVALVPLTLDDILGYGALAAGFPTLTVVPETATSGTYAGTLTVRLVECPACTP